MFRPVDVIRKKRLDDRYEVGDNGVVYSDGLALEPIKGIGVNLHGERKKISYLVARAFVPNPESRPYVRHLNGDVTDNRADNLEWSEVEEKKRRGPKPAVGYCTAWDLHGERVGTWRCPGDAAVDLCVDVRTIRRCLHGKQKVGGGYLWRWGA